MSRYWAVKCKDCKRNLGFSVEVELAKKFTDFVCTECGLCGEMSIVKDTLIEFMRRIEELERRFENE